jgi:hypothetical protein
MKLEYYPRFLLAYFKKGIKFGLERELSYLISFRYLILKTVPKNDKMKIFLLKMTPSMF